MRSISMHHGVKVFLLHNLLQILLPDNVGKDSFYLLKSDIYKAHSIPSIRPNLASDTDFVKPVRK